MIDRKARIQPGRIFLACIVFLLVPILTFAGDGKLLRTQGLINPGANLKKGFLVINEMKVYIDKKTELWDHREMPVLINEFSPKRWVYMEIEKDSGGKIRAKKIYLLPRYVNASERKNFPFMK